MLSSAEHRRVYPLLEKLGCNEREADIYLACLSMDASSVQEIARTLGMNRFTVHSAVEQLIRKGLLFETRRGKRRLIVAEEPSALFRLIERRKGDLEQLAENAEYVEKILRSLLPASQGKPSVRSYEGIEGYKRMLDETATARGEVLIFSYVPLLAQLVGPDVLEASFRKRARKGIATRLIFPPSPFADRIIAKSKEFRSVVRLLPQMQWKSGIFSWNDNVALLSYTQNRLTCTIIENKDIADFYRRIIFAMCWQQAADHPKRAGN